MKRRTFALQVVFWSGVAVAACSAKNGSSGFGDGGGGGQSSGGSQGSGTGLGTGGHSTSVSGATMLKGVDSGMSSGAQPDAGPCPYMTGTVDHDGDGWSPADGDCNDCNKYINPGAYDIPGDGVDEDCSGKADDEPTGCDSTLSSEATTDGEDAAKAMDLCRTTTSAAPLPMKTWGVMSAAYVLPDSAPTPTTTGFDDEPCQYSLAKFQLGFGILGPTFGPMNKTQEGVRMFGLSSGTARVPTDSDYSPVWGFDKCYTSGAPGGFPGQTPACGDVTFGKPHDGAALQLVLRVPTNALTMSFDSNFFSYEFPEYVCSSYNDTFVVIMLPSPSGEPVTAHDNIAFDSMANIISINAGFLRVCDPTNRAGSQGTGPNMGRYVYACPEGPSKLQGTGFGNDSPAPPRSLGIPDPQENHASTDWLTTTVSVAALAGQQITLLFAVWDSYDGVLDTTVLLDNVHWTFATLPNTVVPVDAGSPMTMPK